MVQHATSRKAADQALNAAKLGGCWTAPERELLALLGQAASAEAIATQLKLSINTVRKHIAASLTKLHAN